MRDVTRRVTRAATALLLLAGASLALAAPAGAQTESDELYETCALYQPIVATGGQTAIDNINELRALAPPNPAGVDDAFDIIIDLEDQTGTSPTNDEVEAAFDILDGYYGDLCDRLDLCPLTDLINTGTAAESQQAAAWLGGISTPAPPGIGAALAVLAGDLTPAETSGLVDSESAARFTVLDWFGDDSCGRLAVTGPSATLALTVAGLGVILAGGAILGLRRYANRGVGSDLNW